MQLLNQTAAWVFFLAGKLALVVPPADKFATRDQTMNANQA
jgi:hypothetical protein